MTLLCFKKKSPNVSQIVRNVHVDYEDTEQGLGAVVSARSGESMLVTWHCPSYDECEGSRGLDLYVLDSSTPPAKPYFRNSKDSNFFSVRNVKRLPLEAGGVAMDVSCSEEGSLCIVSLSKRTGIFGESLSVGEFEY
jgi:hypothetical protein